MVSASHGSAAANDAFTLVLACLYARHKGYEVPLGGGIKALYQFEGDALLHDLLHSCLEEDSAVASLSEFLDFLSAFPQCGFEVYYASVLGTLFERFCIASARYGDEFFTPAAVTRLMAYFVECSGSRSVYDPFCGTASLAYHLSKGRTAVSFGGQELSRRTSLYARLMIEAVSGRDDVIRVGDSAVQWSDQHFDAVVTCPPFGLRLSQKQMEKAQGFGADSSCRTFEELLLARAFSVNHADLTVTLYAKAFCYGEPYGKLRTHLVEDNLLDTVISLPAGIFYGMSRPCIILVCRRGRPEGAPVTFVRGEDYVLGSSRSRALDIERLLAMLKGDRKDCLEVCRSQIAEYGYSLSPELYGREELAPGAGQRIVKLGDLIRPLKGTLATDPVAQAISPRCKGNNVVSVIRHKNELTAVETGKNSNRFRRYHAEDKAVLLAPPYIIGVGKGYGLFTEGGDFCLSDTWRAFEIADALVLPEYLVYLLQNDPAITQRRTPLDRFLNLPVIIDSPEAQREIIHGVLQRYEEQETAERKADDERKGAKQNLSDFEHMVTPTIMRIDKILSRLSRPVNQADKDKVAQLTTSLKDNWEYMRRTLHFANTSIDAESINKVPCDIAAFLERYVDAWRNYGGNYFELELVNELPQGVSVPLDKNLLPVLCDSILSNAVRHGFLKNAHHTDHNLVQIRLSAVEYQSNPYVCISFSNNGEPMAVGFSPADYISRGRYSRESGRSGLGGYHVYRITRKHEGHLHIGSSKAWNMVIDVLLPVSSDSCETFTSYDYECL